MLLCERRGRGAGQGEILHNSLLQPQESSSSPFLVALAEVAPSPPLFSISAASQFPSLFFLQFVMVYFLAVCLFCSPVSAP